VTTTRQNGRESRGERRSVGMCLPSTQAEARTHTGIESWYPYYAGYTEEFTRGVLRVLGEGESLTILESVERERHDDTNCSRDGAQRHRV
jgi:hypothetical protein